MSTRLTLDPSQRIFIVGATGSGKSYLARHILRQFTRRRWRVVIIDPKHFWMGTNPQWPAKGPGTVDAPRLVKRFDPKLAVQCFQPEIPAWDDPGFHQLCHDILESQNVVVYVDEIDGVADSAHAQPISRLWTQGRALNVAAISGVQRPSNIPEVLKSQAETWIVLTVRGKKDRVTVAEYTGRPEMAEEALPKHWWWLWHAADGVAHKMRPIPYEAKQDPAARAS